MNTDTEPMIAYCLLGKRTPLGKIEENGEEWGPMEVETNEDPLGDSMAVLHHCVSSVDDGGVVDEF